MANPIELDSSLRSQPSGLPLRLRLVPTGAPAKRHEGQPFAEGLALTPLRSPEFPPAEADQRLMATDERFATFLALDKATNKQVAAQSFDGHPLVPHKLVLFSVIVALEWAPSRASVQQLMDTFRGASDLLYDATDGQMAFGQVIFTGRADMARADIQVLASSRFHPRSWVNGLNDPEKFSPVRLGRGIWNKNNGVIIPWSEPDGQRTIVHEWGHYALSLRDEYIDEFCAVSADPRDALRLQPARAANLADAQLVVPRVSVTLGSIMAMLSASEIVPQQRGQLPPKALGHLLNKFSENFAGLHLPGGANPGPRRLPVDLPQFYSTGGLNSNDFDAVAEEWALDVNGLDLGHCWLYALELGADGTPARVVPQGSVDARARDLRLPEYDETIAGAGFTVLGVSAAAALDQAGRLKILAIGAGEIGARCLVATGLAEAPRQAGAQPLITPRSWEPLEADQPIVAVRPAYMGEDKMTWPDFPVRVHVHGGQQPDGVWLGLPGQALARLTGDWDAARGSWESEELLAEHLDGLVLLQYGTGENARFWVAEYSHGGNPPTTVRSPAPISAGSPDGNLMLYCRSEVDLYEQLHKENQAVRIVTTRNQAGFAPPNGALARSYMFSLSANRAVPTAQLSPTLVLHYDQGTLDEDGELTVYRRDESRPEGWQALATYAPGGAFYAAFPLDGTSAPALVGQAAPAQGRIEYYQLFLRLRESPAGAGAPSL